MKTWNPSFFEAAIASGVQVCVRHQGAHQWAWFDASDGICVGDLPPGLQEALERERKKRATKNVE